MSDVRTDWLGRWALYAPDRAALVDPEAGRTITYAEADLRARRAARWLRDAHGVAPGDRVALLAPNDLDAVLLFFATRRLGAILVPVNWRLAPPEVAHVLRDAAPRVTVVASEFAALAADAGASLSASPPVAAFDALVGAMDAGETLADDAGDFDAPCMILYTSGTTGAPKGAVLTNRSVFWNAVNTTLRLNLTEADRTAIFAPLFHTGGWHVLTTPLLHAGGTVYLMRRFEPDAVLRLCDDAGLTILFGVPTMMAMLHDAPAFASARLGSVRYAIVGGEPMPVPLIHAWQAKGVPIRQGYGLTEFGPNVFSLPEADAVRKAGSIGFPNFYIDVGIVGADGAPVADGEVGELLLRGPAAMDGYWQNPEATAETIVGGWLRTGDLVRRDAEGYVYVAGRTKEMFISGAENVYPAEVEAALAQHPAVAAVAVVGVPDARWGEVGHAVVVRRAGADASADDLRAFCDGRLARFKIPKHVSFADALPVADSGKVLRRALRDWPLPATSPATP